MVRSLEQTTMRKVYLRILPFAALTYFMCYLDRINVGFAALTMNKDLGLDAGDLRYGGRRVLLGLCAVRGAEQHHPRKGRRADLDRPHHDHLGHHSPAAPPSSPARTASWRCASCSGLAEAGSVPRFRALFHLLVPGRLPRPHQFRVHAGPADRGCQPARRFRPRSWASTGCGVCAAGRCMYILEAIPTVADRHRRVSST